MKDQIDALAALGVPAARLDSSLSLEEVRDVSERLRRGELRLLYVAPERFNNERFVAQLAGVRDRALRRRRGALHLGVGPQLPPRLPQARAARARAGRRPRAGADGDRDARRRRRHLRGLRHRARRCRRDRRLPPEPHAADDAGDGRRARRRCCVERLRSRPPGSTIVYVTLQRTALRIAELLAGAGLPARPYHAGMKDEERTAVQEWWAASEQRHRGRDDRLRHGHRQGRRALRLPLQPAQGPRELRPGDRPRRARRRAVGVRAARLPRRRARARELRLRRHAEPRGARGAARRAARGRAGRRARRRRVRRLDALRRAPARPQDAAHLPRARGAPAPGHAVLRRLSAAAGWATATSTISSLASIRHARIPAPRHRGRASRAASG